MEQDIMLDWSCMSCKKAAAMSLLITITAHHAVMGSITLVKHMQPSIEAFWVTIVVTGALAFTWSARMTTWRSSLDVPSCKGIN